MSGLKPSNIKRMQQEGKNPLDSSAYGEVRVNALGRRYKLSKGKDSGRKYYEQPNGSWSLNVPKVSLTPRTEEPLPLIAEVEPPKEQMLNGKDPRSRPPERSYAPAIEAPAIEAPAMNGKDPNSRPFIRPRIQRVQRVVSQPVEQMWNDSDPDPVSRSRKKFQYCQKYGCNRGRRNSNSSQKTRRHRASRKHRRTYRK